MDAEVTYPDVFSLANPAWTENDNVKTLAVIGMLSGVQEAACFATSCTSDICVDAGHIWGGSSSCKSNHPDFGVNATISLQGYPAGTPDLVAFFRGRGSAFIRHPMPEKVVWRRGRERELVQLREKEQERFGGGAPRVLQQGRSAYLFRWRAIFPQLSEATKARQLLLDPSFHYKRKQGFITSRVLAKITAHIKAREEGLKNAGMTQARWNALSDTLSTVERKASEGEDLVTVTVSQVRSVDANGEWTSGERADSGSSGAVPQGTNLWGGSGPSEVTLAPKPSSSSGGSASGSGSGSSSSSTNTPKIIGTKAGAKVAATGGYQVTARLEYVFDYENYANWGYDPKIALGIAVKHGLHQACCAPLADDRVFEDNDACIKNDPSKLVPAFKKGGEGDVRVGLRFTEIPPSDRVEITPTLDYYDGGLIAYPTTKVPRIKKRQLLREEELLFEESGSSVKGAAGSSVKGAAGSESSVKGEAPEGAPGSEISALDVVENTKHVRRALSETGTMTYPLHYHADCIATSSSETFLEQISQHWQAGATGLSQGPMRYFVKRQVEERATSWFSGLSDISGTEVADELVASVFAGIGKVEFLPVVSSSGGAAGGQQVVVPGGGGGQELPPGDNGGGSGNGTSAEGTAGSGLNVVAVGGSSSESGVFQAYATEATLTYRFNSGLDWGQTTAATKTLIAASVMSGLHSLCCSPLVPPPPNSNGQKTSKKPPYNTEAECMGNLANQTLINTTVGWVQVPSMAFMGVKTALDAMAYPYKGVLGEANHRRARRSLGDVEGVVARDRRGGEENLAHDPHRRGSSLRRSLREYADTFAIRCRIESSHRPQLQEINALAKHLMTVGKLKEYVERHLTKRFMDDELAQSSGLSMFQLQGVLSQAGVANAGGGVRFAGGDDGALPSGPFLRPKWKMPSMCRRPFVNEGVGLSWVHPGCGGRFVDGWWEPVAASSKDGGAKGEIWIRPGEFCVLGCQDPSGPGGGNGRNFTSHVCGSETSPGEQSLRFPDPQPECMGSGALGAWGPSGSSGGTGSTTTSGGTSGGSDSGGGTTTSSQTTPPPVYATTTSISMPTILVLQGKSDLQKKSIGSGIGEGLHKAACQAVVSMFASLEDCFRGVGTDGVKAEMRLNIDTRLVGETQPVWPYAGPGGGPRRKLLRGLQQAVTLSNHGEFSITAPTESAANSAKASMDTGLDENSVKAATKAAIVARASSIGDVSAITQAVDSAVFTKEVQAVVAVTVAPGGSFGSSGDTSTGDAAGSQQDSSSESSSEDKTDMIMMIAIAGAAAVVAIALVCVTRVILKLKERAEKAERKVAPEDRPGLPVVSAPDPVKTIGTPAPAGALSMYENAALLSGKFAINLNSPKLSSSDVSRIVFAQNLFTQQVSRMSFFLILFRLSSAFIIV